MRVLGVVAVSLLVGCYAGPRGGADGAGTDGDDGGTASDDGGGGDDGDSPQARCEESKIGPPMLRRLTRHEFDMTIRAVFPEIEASFDGVALGADTISAQGFGNDADVLVVSEQTAREILDTAEHVAELVAAPEALAALLPCSTTTADAGCAETFAEDYGERLFRRPLSAGERAEYLELFSSVDADAGFTAGLKWMLVALLQSPHVVYRSELGADSEDGRRTLQGWELATALAYDFSGRPPDAELRARGADGSLADPEARVAEARRLLGTPAGRDTVHRFFEDWLDYREVASKQRPDVPEFEAVREAMAEETRRFIESVVFDDDGGVDTLLLADYTHLDGSLAAYYGYGEASGDFAMVPRPESWSVGLLAQGSLLAANAHVTASSPTRRGLLVYERFLCQERPPVPADVPPISDPSPGVTTTRQRYEEEHMVSEACRSCHQLFDPVGFGFEHFDAAGRFRQEEAGLPIDASGELPAGIVGDGPTFDGLTGLSQTLADAPERSPTASAA